MSGWDEIEVGTCGWDEVGTALNAVRVSSFFNPSQRPNLSKGRKVEERVGVLLLLGKEGDEKGWDVGTSAGKSKRSHRKATSRPLVLTCPNRLDLHRRPPALRAALEQQEGSDAR